MGATLLVLTLGPSVVVLVLLRVTPRPNIVLKGAAPLLSSSLVAARPLLLILGAATVIILAIGAID